MQTFEDCYIIPLTPPRSNPDRMAPREAIGIGLSPHGKSNRWVSMTNLAMALLVQATLIGPPDTSSEIKKPKSEAAKDCEKTQTDGIVVCAQATRSKIVTNQIVGPIAPPTRNPFTRSDNGLMSLKNSEDAVVDGGGPKGSTELGVRIRF